MSPFGGIGRGMKVGKEELCGLLAAVELYLKVDHEAEFRELDARVATPDRSCGVKLRVREVVGKRAVRQRRHELVGVRAPP